VKRKNITGPAVIAEATKSTGAVMASQMKNISEASLEVQVKLFLEQLSYQRERDLRLHETAKLTVIKQNEMVQCFRELIAVLAVGLAANPPVPHLVQTGSTFPTASLPVYNAEAFPTSAGLRHGDAPQVSMHAAGMSGQQVRDAGHYTDNTYSAAGPSAPHS